VAQDYLYVVIGKAGPFSGTTYPVCWRLTAKEADVVLEALYAQAEAFSAWKLNMQLNNSKEKYDELIEQYVSTQMLDPDYVDGVDYETWAVPDDPTITRT